MRTVPLSLAALGLAGLVLTAAGMSEVNASARQSQNPDTWQIPPNAADEKNPIEATPENIARGRKIYGSKCERCHGPEGRGDGMDADPDHPAGDLTDERRAARNPDGVMFYKIWNGRTKPKMPAFKSEMTKDEVWTVINYVKTLRGT